MLFKPLIPRVGMAQEKTTKSPIALEIVVGVAVIVLIAVAIYAVTQPVPAVTSTISSTTPYSTVSYSTSASTSVPATTGGCPNINYRINNTITSATGFVTYMVSGYTDYVLSPGGNAEINYTSIVTPLNGQTPNILNKSQLVSWANGVQYQISNDTLDSAVNSSTSKISISFTITQENLTQNTTEYKVSAKFFTTVGAPKDTYYITLGPGLPFCGAEMPLITVGAGPYNGTIPGSFAA
jgi:hypothetical protein